MSEVLRINMQYSDVRCELCGEQTRYCWSIPTYNGDVVSNDFSHEAWTRSGGSIAVCERCFTMHAKGQVVTYDHLYMGKGERGLVCGDGDGI